MGPFVYDEAGNAYDAQGNRVDQGASGLGVRAIQPVGLGGKLWGNALDAVGVSHDWNQDATSWKDAARNTANYFSPFNVAHEGNLEPQMPQAVQDFVDTNRDMIKRVGRKDPEPLDGLLAFGLSSGVGGIGRRLEGRAAGAAEASPFRQEPAPSMLSEQDWASLPEGNVGGRQPSWEKPEPVFEEIGPDHWYNNKASDEVSARHPEADGDMWQAWNEARNRDDYSYDMRNPEQGPFAESPSGIAATGAVDELTGPNGINLDYADALNNFDHSSATLHANASEKAGAAAAYVGGHNSPVAVPQGFWKRPDVVKRVFEMNANGAKAADIRTAIGNEFLDGMVPTNDAYHRAATSYYSSHPDWKYRRANRGAGITDEVREAIIADAPFKSNKEIAAQHGLAPGTIQNILSASDVTYDAPRVTMRAQARQRIADEDAAQQKLKADERTKASIERFLKSDRSEEARASLGISKAALQKYYDANPDVERPAARPAVADDIRQSIIDAVKNGASYTEAGAPHGRTRGSVAGIIDRAKKDGIYANADERAGTMSAFMDHDVPFFDDVEVPGTRAAEPQAPYVKRNDGELFDYGLQDGMPVDNPLNIPEQPYYEGARGMPERMEAIVDNPKVTRRVNKAVEKGLEENGNAALNWYNNEPLRERWNDLYRGEGSPDAAFQRYMESVGVTSPQNAALPNAAHATQIYHRLQNGQEIPRDVKQVQAPGFDTPGAGTRLIVARKKFGHEDGYDPAEAPKTEFFGRSLAGDDSKVVVDSHASRLLAMSSEDPRFINTSQRYHDVRDNQYKSFNPREMLESGEATKKDLLNNPTWWWSRPTKAEYKFAAQPFEKAAKKYGLSPGQAQAAAWYGAAEKTGVKTPPKTFNELFEQRLRENAADRGISPERLLDDVINGRDVLYANGEPLPLPGPFQQEDQ